MSEKVIIIGAGPTGLALALELSHYEIPFRILDSRPSPVRTSNALGIHTRTLEVFREMGVIEKILKAGNQVRGFNIHSKHKTLFRADWKNLRSPYPFVLTLPQNETEQILLQALEDRGFSVERPQSFQRLIQHSDRVELETDHETLDASWVVGADGAHSLVREQLGLAFIGNESKDRFIMMDAPLEFNLPEDEAHAFFARSGVLAFVPLKKQGFWRVIADVTYEPELSKIKMPQIEHFDQLIKKRCAYSIKLGQPLWTSSFWIHRKLAERYHLKRVFLAGDAAHIHSPVGGQGMNIGIQDAHNLAWKLAYVMKGWAKKSLLETYERERYPVAKKILHNTAQITRVLTLKTPFSQAIRNSLLQLLGKIPQFKDTFIKEMSEMCLEYSQDDGIAKSRSKDRKGIQVGSFAKNSKIGKGSCLFNHLDRKKYTLLVFKTEGGIDKLRHLTKRYAFLDCCIVNIDIKGDKKEIFNDYAHYLYLIRPDKNIAFRDKWPCYEKLVKFMDQMVK